MLFEQKRLNEKTKLWEGHAKDHGSRHGNMIFTHLKLQINDKYGCSRRIYCLYSYEFNSL